MKRQSLPALAIRVGAVGALATFCGALSVTPSVAASLVVQTEDGPVRGNVAIGVENFLDIPYAAPPSANCAGARRSLPHIGAM